MKLTPVSHNPFSAIDLARRLKRAEGGQIDTIKRKLLAEDAITDSASRMPDEIPPEAVLNSKGISPSRKHGDAMDFYAKDIFTRSFEPPPPQNLAAGGAIKLTPVDYDPWETHAAIRRAMHGR